MTNAMLRKKPTVGSPHVLHTSRGLMAALMTAASLTSFAQIVEIDVTKPPYCADNTGKTDCTKVLVKVLDDILIREVEAYEGTVEKLKRLSDDGKTDV